MNENPNLKYVSYGDITKSNLIKNEGRVSQIFDLGLSFHFMLCRRENCERIPKSN